MKKRLLCIWLPNWPVQRAQAEEPRLASVPFLLSRQDPRRGFLVAAANLKARGEGIRPAMRLSEATTLVDAEVLEHDPQEDIEVLCSLAEQAQQFSPLVGIEQLGKKMWAGRTLHQPECLLLDVTGIAPLFGGEDELVQTIALWLKRQSYFGCIALANSLGTAWALANYALREAPTSKADSDTEDGSDKQESTVPDSRSVIIESGHDALALDALPFPALRLSPDTVASLRRLGLREIGELQSLPRDGLATRLGQDLIDQWDCAMGVKEEALVNLHSSPDWCLEQTLENPTGNCESLKELVRRLTQQLSQRLKDRGQGAIRILCRFDLVESAPLLIQLSLFRPTNDSFHLENLLVGQLEQELQSQSAPAWRLNLQATLIAPLIWRQADLFAMEEAENRNEVARLVDTLASRLGRKQVLSANLRRESQPDLAFTWQPITGRKTNGQEQSTVKRISSRIARQRAEPSVNDPLRRPASLYPIPVPIDVQAAESQAPDEHSSHATDRPGQLIRIRYQGEWFLLVETIGPERLESGWWRGPSNRRDYYRIETRKGNWWWIYRDLKSGQWFLHGAFE